MENRDSRIKRSRIFSKLRLIALGLLVSLALSQISPLVKGAFIDRWLMPSAIAQEPPAFNHTTALQQEQQARQLYQQRQFSEAIMLWQAAANAYAQQSNLVAEASVLSNLALSYQAIGEWSSAWAAIEQSSVILSELDVLSHAQADAQITVQAVAAQMFMNKGHLYIESGEAQQALSAWEQAEEAYTFARDGVGSIRAQLNQAQALRVLGFYRRSLDQYQAIVDQLEAEPPTVLKAIALRRLGDALRLNGQLVQSENVLNQSFSDLQQVREQQVREDQDAQKSEVVRILLSLGHTALEKGEIDTAQQKYEQAWEIADKNHSSTLLLPIELAQLSLSIDSRDKSNSKDLARVFDLSDTIRSRFASLPLSRTNIYHQINWTEKLLSLSASAEDISSNRLDIEVIAQQLTAVVSQTRSLGDTRAEAYALGLLAQAYADTEQWRSAIDLTQRAIDLSDRAQAIDVLYRWQWQLGRLWNHAGNPQRSATKAMNAYDRSIDALSTLRGDLAAADAQFSFSENVEPVYREMVSLLLDTDLHSDHYQENLVRAQEVLDSLRVAELDNYFREACADVSALDARQADPNAAIVHTIVLRDRLSIILNLPNQPLQHVSVPISKEKVTRIAKRLRQELVIRSRRDYFDAAKQAYELLIAPIREPLDSSGVDTIVFVSDGPLQTIPLSALYDGDRFLIEDYAVGLTPSLKLTDSSPWSAANSKHNQRTLIGGLTEGRAGFSSLPYVDSEVENITRIVGRHSVLLNQDFTKERLARQLKTKAYPIVHIATHGQFGSTPKETFLLTWDGRIDVRDINEMLQANLGSREGIKLLLLSACETAVSDPKAGLGLAGISVKAGASSTLGSLWSINDEATAHFVDIFYQQLMKPDTTRAAALRQTQMTLLKDPQYQHPIYWAAYIMLGSWL